MKANIDQTEAKTSEKLTLDHPEVLAALDEHLHAIQSGKPGHREELLTRFPELAAELTDCLEGMSFLCLSGDGDQGALENLDEPLGDFRLLREIGRGGMGIVYEAEQISLARRVALKVLPFAATLDPRQLQRFKQEAQAAACLHHPHIVPVYAVGEARGAHYYAMQFIEGQTLADPIRELRKTAQSDDVTLTRDRPPEDPTITFIGDREDAKTETISKPKSVAVPESGPHRTLQYLRRVAEMGKQAAEALDHAHQIGVVHRDIKPANILLDKQGQIWVTDFGLAHLESQGELTMTGDLVGTLRYMSPEQAQAQRGIVDHRTDIYSLGATIYELLTLQPLHDGESTEELLGQIIHDDPKPPRQWNRMIPVDLETIVLKATAKRAEDRYATAQELADDLERFLKDQPIQARRPSLPTRIIRWSRRHRSLVATSVVVLLLAAVGLAVSTWLVWQAKAKAQQSYEAEITQRREAEANFQQAREMLDFFTEVIENDLAEYPDAREVRIKLLEESLVYYSSFIKKAQGNPALKEELLNTHFRVATILDEMGENRRAQASFTKAFDLGHKLLRSRPNDHKLKEELAKKYQFWAWANSKDVVRQIAKSSVRKELKLTPEQLKEVNEVFQKHNSFYQTNRGQMGRNRENVWNRFNRTSQETAKQLTALLTPEQNQRLDEIILQQKGTMALHDPKVRQKLELTPDQEEKMDKTLNDPKFRSQGRRFDPRKFNEWGKALLAILTPEQRAKWKKMLGKKFEDRTQFRWGGRSRFGRSRDRSN